MYCTFFPMSVEAMVSIHKIGAYRPMFWGCSNININAVYFDGTWISPISGITPDKTHYVS